MEVPEKLYFGESDKGILDIYSTKESDNEVEYVCTDAFIEKAIDWLEDHIYEYLKINRTWNEPDYDPKLIENFVKYMKEE